MTIKNKIFGILGIILLLLWSSIGIAVVKLVSQEPELAKTVHQVEKVSNRAIPLLITIKEIKIDIIQVQGWLTDISATRGLPGFDDGFVEAEGFAQKFTEDVELARTHANALEMPEVLKALDELQAAFPAFYAGGKKMAQAYIDTGPEGGNPQMEVFDSVAKVMGDASDLLVQLVDDQTSAYLNNLNIRTRGVSENNKGLISQLIAFALFSAIATLVGVIYLFNMLTKSFRDLNDDVEAVMSKNNTIALKLDSERSDEFGPIALALSTFRESIMLGKKAEAERRQAEALEQKRQRNAEAAATKAETARVEKRETKNRAILLREQKAAKEIASVVAACALGDFNQRLITEDKEGVFAEICEGVNQVCEITSRGLGEIKVALEALSVGNLTYSLDGDLCGIFGEIQKTVNATSESLASSIGNIDHSSQAIGESAREVAISAGHLATRTEQSAASLEETAAAIEVLSGHVTKTAELATQANGKASDVQRMAVESNDIVDSNVIAMQEIKTSTAAIRKTITLIDDITFQTNLLALNAGVEAARAGEAGRGFAVVASEVRELAAKSSEAAQTISALIERSEQQVANGVAKFDQTGAVLKSISEGVSSIASQIADISSSAAEQSESISEINLAAKQLDKTTQQNAAMFEETTATSAALQQETDNLAQVINAFDIDRAQTPTEPDAMAPHSPEASHPQAVVQQRTTASLEEKTEDALDEEWNEF